MVAPIKQHTHNTALEWLEGTCKIIKQMNAEQLWLKEQLIKAGKFKDLEELTEKLNEEMDKKLL